MNEKAKRRVRTSTVLLALVSLLLVLVWVDINAGYREITLSSCGRFSAAGERRA